MNAGNDSYRSTSYIVDLARNRVPLLPGIRIAQNVMTCFL